LQLGLRNKNSNPVDIDQRILKAISTLLNIQMLLARISALLLALSIVFSVTITLMPVHGQEPPPPQGPYVVDDPVLTVQKYAEGLKFPTSMAFLGENDLLVLEKNDGTVRRIVNGTLLPDPLLDVAVGNLDERGMLGIAVSKNEQGGVRYVFVYYTEMPDRDGSDVNGTIPIANKLFRYEFAEGKLVNGKLLLEIPAKYTDNHNGGSMLIGPDDNLYLTVGDQQEPGQQPFIHISTTQNKPDTLYPDLTGGILRMTQDGKPVQNLFGGNYPIDMYYAYGVRNSFGIDFDPVTGVLWDTENGPDLKDEINRVEPGFNSGWRYLQGFIEADTDLSQLVEFPGLSAAKDSLVGRAEAISFKAQGLGGKFSEPEFVWQLPIAPTALIFLNSEELGDKYENDLFVASFNRGEIYNFDLTEDRSALELTGPLEDKTENNPAGYDGLKFARNFGGITDMVVGPDGYLYVNGFFNGNIYRILTVEDAAIPEFPVPFVMALAIPTTFAAVIFIWRFYLSKGRVLSS
jgi:glucose/arabinose dehydrogenase